MSTLLAGLTFDARVGLLQGRGHALHLPAGQARLFAVLWRAASADPGLYLSGTAIAERLGGSPRDLHAPAIRLRAKLKPFGVALDSRMGAGGGYRLCQLATSSRTKSLDDDVAVDASPPDCARPAMREVKNSGGVR